MSRTMDIFVEGEHQASMSIADGEWECYLPLQIPSGCGLTIRVSDPSVRVVRRMVGTDQPLAEQPK